MEQHELDSKRREWAQGEIETVRRQIQGLRRRMLELRAFVALLDRTAAQLKTAHHPRSGHDGGERTLGDYLAEALAEAGTPGLEVGEVAERVVRLGYQHKAQTPIRVYVGAELARQAERGLRGIHRVKVGRYAIGS